KSQTTSLNGVIRENTIVVTKNCKVLISSVWNSAD
ncbi:MAG: hypothetical protein ACI81G_000312, partial [Gammaproteobacteria bacterium]